MLPKRFPDRDEIAKVRAEADALETGTDGAEQRRVAGRVLARRDLGKLMFLDLVDRSGRIQLLVRPDELGGVNLDLGDVIGVAGVATKTKRGEPSLTVSELV
ncbi:MAG: lysyl-tRNA synthetase, class [Gaiellaceae bacterium]|nr:lysyl-tRNA synthetase, class [Gaiellaceae bacterium]